MQYSVNELSEIINNLNIFKSWEFTNKTILSGTLTGITIKMLTEDDRILVVVDDFSKYQVSFSIENNELFLSFGNNSDSFSNYFFFVPVVNRFYKHHLFKVVSNMKFL